MIFRELPLTARPQAARSAGFEAIEMWWPFPGEPAPPSGSIHELCAAIEDAGVALVSLNLDTGDQHTGDRGLMCRAEHRARLRENTSKVAEIARRLGCERINALYGNTSTPGQTSEERRNALEAYAFVCSVAAEVGASVMIEPINTPDAPNYGVRSVDDALSLSHEIAAMCGIAPGVLLDVYRLDLPQPALDEAILAAGDSIMHVQLADRPGRHEPGTGNIDFERVFASLRSAHYASHIGLEYEPTIESGESLRLARRRIGAHPS
ncbi:MAG TPA: TIM barrel protein [Acidimicrobiia bacterium]|nr:TIM barrel protein [Acidimicrobiia bacterium]